jgi:hypothetical protein
MQHGDHRTGARSALRLLGMVKPGWPGARQGGACGLRHNFAAKFLQRSSFAAPFAPTGGAGLLHLMGGLS